MKDQLINDQEDTRLSQNGFEGTFCDDIRLVEVAHSLDKKTEQITDEILDDIHLVVQLGED